MARADVILIKKVAGLGSEADQLTVAAGYARNYLIPQGFAVVLTKANKRRIDVLRQRRISRESQELDSANELSASLSRLRLTIKVKTGEEGRMFGSVTSANIADELRQQLDVHLDRRKIHLDKPVKTLGEHYIELHLHSNVVAQLRVNVESTNPLPDSPAESEGKPAPAKSKPPGGRA